MHFFDIAIKNGLVMTMNPDNSILDNCVIGIKGDSIAYIGKDTGDALKAEKTILFRLFP